MTESLLPNTAYTLNLDIVIASGNANIRLEASNGAIQYIAAVNYINGNNNIQFTTPADIGIGGLSIRASVISDNAFTIDNLVLTAD